MAKPSIMDVIGSKAPKAEDYAVDEEAPDPGSEDITEEGSPEAVFSEMMDPKRTDQERLKSFQALVRSEVTKMNGS